MTTEISGPPVVRDERSAEFFEAAARERLAIRSCIACGHMLGLEARTCTACGSSDLVWTEVSGQGELVTWSIVHHPPHPAFANQVPFPVGAVELAEGPWIDARIIGVPIDRLRVGMPVHVEFIYPEEGDSYPAFAADN
ncbi:hypothetical protein GPX89_26055 [Nocardia sp. ET3-3]|uniref:ChsH2 C-terminal OB-fold domain-containing protein n=1 Tax=Nocardia terrae TaxID=2675851 RepID=A0A7K1V242_9NOCA|nr:OB-fold domain-containing protein [Nocardia terrae]MVU80703.1 hypothetical protein [Nocardia terrae]